MSKQGTDTKVGLHGIVVAVLTGPGGEVKQVSQGRNIVTNAGDLYYAQRGAAETPTNFTSGATFDGIMGYGTAGNAPGKASDRSDITAISSGSELAMDGTYPQTNDSDGDNTGAGTDIVTYRRTYAAGVGTDTGIDRVFITNPTPGASEPLLMYSTISPTVNKGAGDSLKIFVNHEMLGV